MKTPAYGKYLLLAIAAIAGTRLTLWGIHLLKEAISIKKHTIGLVYAPDSAFHKHLSSFLKEKFSLDDRFQIKEFTTDAENLWISSYDEDPKPIKDFCTHTLQDSSVDLFICTGVICAKAMIRIASSLDVKTPLLFVGINDPVKRGLVNSLESPGGTATGVIVRDVFEPRIHPLEVYLAAEPFAKRILLPYGTLSKPLIETMLQKAKDICREKNITLTTLEVPNQKDALQTIAATLPGHDTLMYLEGDILAALGHDLSKLALANHVTMLACSPDGLNCAKFTYCIDFSCLADPLYAASVDVLIYKKEPADIPVRVADLKRNLIFHSPGENKLDRQYSKLATIAETELEGYQSSQSLS